MHPALPIDAATLADFCAANRIRRLSLFGSRLHGTAGPDSDDEVVRTALPQFVGG